MPVKKITKTQKAKEDLSNKSLREIFALGVDVGDKSEHGRTLAVNDLPDCNYKNLLLRVVQNSKDAKIVVVAVKHNQSNMWTAYAGYPDVRDVKSPELVIASGLFSQEFDWLWCCENIRDSEQVKMMGEVLPLDIAMQLFPDRDASKYTEQRIATSPALLGKASNHQKKRTRMNE